MRIDRSQLAVEVVEDLRLRREEDRPTPLFVGSLNQGYEHVARRGRGETPSGSRHQLNYGAHLGGGERLPECWHTLVVGLFELEGKMPDALKNGARSFGPCVRPFLRGRENGH